MRTIYEKFVSSTTANYLKQFGKHQIGLLAGFEAEKNNTDFTRSTGENLPSSALHTVATAGNTKANGYHWGNAMVSVLAKADYNWDEKYYASASWRTDASSKLSPQTRWDSFWSVAASWRIGKEEFLKGVSWLDELKLRASYGTNGTLPSSNYGYMNLITYSNKYMENPGGSISNIGNALLTWETSRSANIGIDFAVLDNRLGGSVEVFNRDSHNLLQDKPVSTVTGFSSTLQNIGKTRNQGLEIELYGDIIRTKNLVWSAAFNASFLRSKVVSLSEGKDILWYDPTGDDDRAQFIYREKESTLAFYGYEWAGVDKTNGKSVYYVNDPEDPKAGDFIFKGRGATYDYDDAYEVIIGNGVAKVAGGISTSLRFKNFDASLGFNYKLGGNIYDGAEKDVADDGYYWERIRSRYYFENRWTPDNPDGTQPELSGLDLEDAMQYSSRHIYSASFLRLKTLSLGYSLPKKWLKAAGITGTRFFFTGTNLLTLSKYKIADPEVNEYGTRGWETPYGKTFTFGVDIKF
jgi:TonB-linked SusC/RagA family outer membrane protein